MSQKKTEETAAPKFSKQQFLKAANFTRIERDVLRSFLRDDEMYTLQQVEKMLNDFKQRKVT